MPQTKFSAQKIATLLTLIFAGEAIFFLPFVLARIFRPTLLRVYEITNLELGACFSVYGIVAMVSYFFGGPLADRYSSRNLMSIALIATGVGGIYMAFVPSVTGLMFLYGYWGATTILLFWAALIKATRLWGGDTNQGIAFGWLEGGRGTIAALLGVMSLFIFSWFSATDQEQVLDGGIDVFQYVVFVTSIITIVAGAVVYWVVPKQNEVKVGNSENDLRVMFTLLSNPKIWMQAVIIVCAYVGYKISDDYTLYANQVLGYSEVDAAQFGTIVFWLRPTFAVIAGLLANRFSGTKVSIGGFVLMLVGGIMTALGILEHISILVIIMLVAAVSGVYAIRGIYFALMEEAQIPKHMTGTAVGLMSVVGFTPDVFMSPWMGYLLDTYPGAEGHRYVFMVLSCFALIGCLVSILFYKKAKSFGT